jgi:predicted cupin superfamily sugar epimerase
LLAPLAEGGTPFIVVPHGEWQSAETMGDYTLVACFVAPGFEFADFEMRATSPRG